MAHLEYIKYSIELISISKGKAGTPVELGLRVCVLQDQFGFTVHHKVMQKKQTDD